MTVATRFALSLRPNVAAEAELLAALDRVNGIHGAKTQLLRDCIRRGVMALQTALEEQSPDATEGEILDALAEKFSENLDSYRVAKLFFDAQRKLESMGGGHRVGSDKARTPISVAQDSPPVKIEKTPEVEDTQTEIVDKQPQEERPQTPPVRDWSNMQGIAGAD